MKQFRIFVVAISFIVLPIVLIGCAEPEASIFHDENLEASIRKSLGKSVDEEIKVAELANLTKLEAESSNISDISGLGYCTNLIDLSLSSNQISDISPLSSLTNLTELDLNGNQIDDISPLSSLTNLIDLGLSSNQISDISPLSSLTNLTELSLYENQISDISPLVKNSGLDEDDLVLLMDNNLDLKEGSEDMRNIRILENRGVSVGY
ncbi:leucine-rich repeat domain-containing protein [Candidatus Pacearchaeota archaeon]|nr:leucine-rich repeat domain-containing protein [Candidatus Pacearchaeota archaeon]